MRLKNRLEQDFREFQRTVDAHTRIADSFPEARKALADDSWRSQADANRQAMMEAGSWGVPSFRFKGKMFWGQDRIPALEQLILSSGD